MFTKFGKINNKIVAIDENEVFYELDNTDGVDVNRSLQLKNLLQKLDFKKINLDFELETLDEDYKNYKTPKRELVKLLSRINISLFALAVLALLVRGAFTLSSTFFLACYEVVMLASTFTINSMAKEEYEERKKDLIKQFDDACKEEEKARKELDDNKTISKEIKTIKVKNIDEDIRELNRYKNTYKENSYQKTKRLSRI